jgi:hypothetical protein
MRSLYIISFFLLSCSVLLSACSEKGTTEESSSKTSSYPQDPEDRRREQYGKLTGEGGLIALGGKEEGSGGASPIGVNSFLWRATLDTLSFLPLLSADPFGGVIITDWYEDPETPGERFKVTALILDRSLRADGVKISLFKQARGKDGQWHDAASAASVAQELEDTILTRARQLRLSQGG